MNHEESRIRSTPSKKSEEKLTIMNSIQNINKETQTKKKEKKKTKLFWNKVSILYDEQ